MTAQTTINCLEFAEKSLVIHGRIPVSTLPRLGDELFARDGEVVYRLLGRINARSEPELELQVQGELSLTCQRCLGPLPFKLDAATRFVLVADEASLPEPEDEDDSAEYLVANPHLDVATLIEDEVLLNLPLAPVHAEEHCGGALDALREEKESPFKVLQGLKLTKS
jgi:uncharacterized protein